MEWRLIDSGPCKAAHNMALDEAIATVVRNGDAPPTLRLYGWECPSVSLGSFQKTTDINLQYCISNDIPVVRRPTGGRGILHGDELTYSFSSKNNGDFSGGLLETYRKLSITFQLALNKMGLNATMKMERESGANLRRSSICFQSTSYGEVSFNDKKIIGSAQKRWKNGFLQQGAIPYSVDYEKTALVFKINTPAPKCPMQKIIGLRELIAGFDSERFKEAIKSSFKNTFNITLIESHPSYQEQELAHLLCYEKYQNPRWTLAGLKNNLSYNNSETQMKAL